MSQGHFGERERIERHKCRHGMGFAMPCSKCLGWLRDHGYAAPMYFDRSIDGLRYRQCSDTLARMNDEMGVDEGLASLLSEAAAEPALVDMARTGQWAKLREALVEDQHRPALVALVRAARAGDSNAATLLGSET